MRPPARIEQVRRTACGPAAGRRIQFGHDHTGSLGKAGGRGLGFRHGRHVKWPKGRVPAANLYLTILQQLGCRVEAFSESTGTLDELLA